MKCEYCDNEVPQGATRCPSCGATVKAVPAPTAPVAAPAAPAAVPVGQYVAVQPVAAAVVMNTPPKSRTAYVLLAIFIGWFGIHNFYAGRSGAGIAQLLISLIVGSATCGLASIVVWIWAII